MKIACGQHNISGELGTEQNHAAKPLNGKHNNK
jgi:hypothetical protein